MLKLIPNPYIIMACLALLGGSFTYGFVKGKAYEADKYEAARLKLQQDAFDLADEIREKNSQIIELQRIQREQSYAIEQEAIEAVGSDSPGISATGGLQRLERRWSKD